MSKGKYDIERFVPKGVRAGRLNPLHIVYTRLDLTTAIAKALKASASEPTIQADADMLCRCGKPDCENCGDGLPVLSL